MADAATEARILGDQIAREEERIAGLRARLAELKEGEKLTGVGRKDEARLMKEAAQAVETTTAEPKVERAIKTRALKRVK